jgi:hypothetical protein
MEQIILDKIKELNQMALKLEHKPLYYLLPEWQELSAQERILKEVLKAHKRAYNIAAIKDIQTNFDCGLITREEYSAEVEKLTTK